MVQFGLDFIAGTGIVSKLSLLVPEKCCLNKFCLDQDFLEGSMESPVQVYSTQEI